MLCSVRMWLGVVLLVSPNNSPYTTRHTIPAQKKNNNTALDTTHVVFRWQARAKIDLCCCFAGRYAMFVLKCACVSTQRETRYQGLDCQNRTCYISQIHVYKKIANVVFPMPSETTRDTRNTANFETLKLFYE